MVKWYECMKWKQMTKGMPATLQNKCLFSWIGELESRYRELKYKKLTKIELQTEQRRLNENLKNLTMKIMKLYPVFQKKIITKMTHSWYPQHPRYQMQRENSLLKIKKKQQKEKNKYKFKKKYSYGKKWARRNI